MLARPLSRFLAARGIHYGWVIAAATFLTSLVMSGAVGLPGAFILPLSGEFGWDVGEISAALAVRLMLFGLMAPFAAAFIERYGMRPVVLVAISLVAIAMVAVPAISQVWHLVALWGVVVGIGTGLTALVLGATVANRWFVKSRGLVLGLMTAAMATGQLAFLPLAAALIERFGWRMALVPSVLALVVVAVLVMLLVVERPVDLGLAPYGETTIQPAPAVRGSPLAAVNRAFATLRDASGSSSFWILTTTFVICGLSTNGLVQTHFISLCADYGMSGVAAASTLALMGALDIVGTVGSGWLSDRVDNRWLLFWYYGLRGLSLLWLPFSGFSFLGLSVFAVFYGLDWIATVPPTVKLVGREFGRERAPLVFGWIFTGHQIGAAVAAFGGGFSRATYMTYLPAFIAGGAACIIAAGLVMILSRTPSRLETVRA